MLSKDYVNVVERLRAGATATDLSTAESETYENGLVLILRELHDRLDRAVEAALGWPADLRDEQILARLLALNATRATEEARGVVRWLRPEYQVPKFASAAERIAFELTGAAPGQERPTSARRKPSYPADDVAQTAAVMAVLAGASAPMDVASIGAGFRQRTGIREKVTAVLSALSRMGYASTADGGRSFVLRDVA
jgi:hypothetical protein